MISVVKTQQLSGKLIIKTLHLFVALKASSIQRLVSVQQMIDGWQKALGV